MVDLRRDASRLSKVLEEKLFMSAPYVSMNVAQNIYGYITVSSSAFFSQHFWIRRSICRTFFDKAINGLVPQTNADAFYVGNPVQAPVGVSLWIVGASQGKKNDNNKQPQPQDAPPHHGRNNTAFLADPCFGSSRTMDQQQHFYHSVSLSWLWWNTWHWCLHNFEGTRKTRSCAFVQGANFCCGRITISGMLTILWIY